MRLTYHAFDKSGRRVVDTLEAPNRAAATHMLRRRGLFVAELHTEAPTGKQGGGRKPKGLGTGRLKPLVSMMQQLHILVAGGTPVVKALAAIERQTNAAAWRSAIADVRTRVEQGTPLSEAMEDNPVFFNPFCRSLVAAGEATGQLAAMLKRVADTTRNQLRLRATLLGAMMYPILLLGISLTVLVVMFVVAVPKFGELFETLDAPVPPVTEAVVSGGTWLRSSWPWVVACLAAVIAALWTAVRQPAGKRFISSTVLRLPLIGRLVRSIITARILRVLGVLLESGVGVMEALVLCRAAIGNHRYADMLRWAEDCVQRGEPMSAAFGDSFLINSSIHQAIQTAEESGQVGLMMLTMADFVDQENEIATRTLTSVMEPVILLVMGLLVGLMAFSMFVPLLDMTSVMGGG
jgi:type II secretory pathway component PulF